MKKNQQSKVINFLIFTASKSLHNWIEASLTLTSLSYNEIRYCTTDEITVPLFNTKKINILITDEATYPKLWTKVENDLSLS